MEAYDNHMINMGYAPEDNEPEPDKPTVNEDCMFYDYWLERCEKCFSDCKDCEFFKRWED